MPGKNKKGMRELIDHSYGRDASERGGSEYIRCSFSTSKVVTEKLEVQLSRGWMVGGNKARDTSRFMEDPVWI